MTKENYVFRNSFKFSNFGNDKSFIAYIVESFVFSAGHANTLQLFCSYGSKVWGFARRIISHRNHVNGGSIEHCCNLMNSYNFAIIKSNKRNYEICVTRFSYNRNDFVLPHKRNNNYGSLY